MAEESVKKTRALIFFRALVVTILFGSLYLIEGNYERFVNPHSVFYIIAFLYFLTIAYAVLLKKINNYRLFTHIQILIDIVIGIFIVALTGGVKSPFSFILFLSIISSSIMLNRKVSYMIALSCSVLYIVMALIQSTELFPVYIKVLTIPSNEYLYYCFVHVNAFILVAYLSSHPGENLRKVMLRLNERDIDLDVLRAFNQDILDHVPCGLFTVDTNGRIIVFNKSARRITKKTLSEVIGMRPEEIFPFIKEMDPDKGRIVGEFLCNSQKIIIGMSFSNIKQGEGENNCLIGIFQDLTQLRKMENEVRKKEKLAAVGELSAAIAHELRNPLASLKGATEMLREGKVSPDQGNRLMDIALKEMDRLNNIVTDFLIYAKPITLVKENFDIHELLTEMLYLIKSRNDNTELVEISEALSGSCFITGDQEKLRQVCWNLSMNALEAMPHGGKFEISTKKTDDEIHIDFMDTGSGISDETKDKIFYPFFTTKSQGSGLGLAISKKITEEHHGKISFATEQNRGTIFSIVLPVNNHG